MSLQGLISGSDCALPNNPLAQVLKHTDSDRSVQRDRIAGPSTSRLQHLPSSFANHASEGDLSLARQFFDANSAPIVHTDQNQIPHDFARRLGIIEGSAYQPQLQQSTGIDLQDLWLRADMQKLSAAPEGPASALPWTTEFGGSLANMQSAPARQLNLLHLGTKEGMHSAYTSSSYFQPSMGIGMYGSAFPQPYAPMQDNGKGKGKLRDDAFEAAFAQYALEAQPRASSARIEEVQSAEIESALENTTISEENHVDNDLQKLWDSMSKVPAPGEDISKWEAELKQLMQAQREEHDLDYGSSMQEAWESGMGLYDNDNLPEGTKFDDEGIPQLGSYVFDPENKHLASVDTHSCLEQAKYLLENNGSLSEAALLLEAAIQKGDLGKDGYEAWILLGETRCMDEREEAGIRALMEGVRRAEEAGAKGAGMLSLATAFTNENYERGSHAMLLHWLLARFPEYSPPPETAASLKSTYWNSHERVTEAFLAVARAQHAMGLVNADVQTGLGILFYTNSDFDRAKDCFAAALAVHPKDYLLWNRLGSALSNGNKPEEALGAYREALQMRPMYTRAIYNVGVACLNIGADKEAAEHFLSALSLQETTTQSDKSEQLWFTLRRAFISMGRDDLANKAQLTGDVGAFRAEGFDF
ncbi:hypothetical protein EW145_g2051 [Phellinidium pouzarii]|uniref:Uncharacterized protein n=1 Tax=Phellinidium pouzarii TaxID=167371 RepID=A0A4S4LC92_9AGAM|nr:hypothetical protein EW145_g2051 [Phellinidium pouzarii]